MYSKWVCTVPSEVNPSKVLNRLALQATGIVDAHVYTVMLVFVVITILQSRVYTAGPQHCMSSMVITNDASYGWYWSSEASPETLLWCAGIQLWVFHGRSEI